MRLALWLAFFVVVAVFCSCGSKSRVLIINANIITEEGKVLYDRALLVENQIIKEIASSEELLNRVKCSAIIDIKHMWLYPGFFDAHLHILGTGRWLSQPDLTVAKSVSDIQRILQRYIEENPESQWIIGRGWDQNNWMIKEFPDRIVLDEVNRDRPILLYRVDGHAVWVNSRVLEIAGIDKTVSDPEGGKILRMEDGTPSGVLVDKAMDLVTKFIPRETFQIREDHIKRALKYFVSMGLTEVHDAYVDISLISLFKGLADHGELPLRVYLMVGDGSDTESLVGYMRENKPVVPEKTGFLTVRAVKVFADGALGSRGALLFLPYEDDRLNGGLSLISHGELLKICNTAKETGYQVAVHAIGDSACYFVLRTFLESAGGSVKSLRWRVEHAQILCPEEREFKVGGRSEFLSSLQAFGRFGIIPSMQPVHCISDMPWVEKRIGKARARFSYAWNTLIKNRAVIPAGTDCPVEIASPLLNFYAAVTRKDTSGYPAKGWFPEEKVDRVTALKMLTVWGAFASFKENFKGRIHPGYLADFTVLDRNILSIPEEEILTTKVMMTIVGGKPVYKNETF